MVRQSWINRLIRRQLTAKPSAAHQRPAFSPVQLEFLEDRTAPAGADLWANATAIPQGNPSLATFSDPTDNTTYTSEAGEPVSAINSTDNPAKHSAWWKTTVTVPGAVTVDTNGTNFNGYGDTSLEVFTGTALNNLTILTDPSFPDNGGKVFNDDIGGTPYNPSSKVSFHAVAGTTYYIRLNGYDNTNFGLNQFHYTFTADPQPATDKFVNAPAIPTGYPTVVVSNPTNNTTFTLDPGEPASYINNGSGSDAMSTHTGWWKTTVVAPGIVTLDTKGTNYNNYGDTSLEVFTGTAIDNLTILNDPTFPDNSGDVYNDDVGGTPYDPTSRVFFHAVPGTTYYIRLAGYSDANFGLNQFHYSYVADPQTLTSIARGAPTGQITNANAVTFRVTFGQDSKNVDASDFTTTFGTVGTVTPVNAAQYDVQVTGLNAVNGTLTLGLAAGNNIQSTAGYALTTLTPTGTIDSYTADHVAPTLASIVRQNPAVSPATASGVTYRVAFSEDVTIAAANFSVNAGTLGTVTPVGGTSHAYDVPVTGLGAFNGTLTLSFAGSTIQDLAGNNLPSTTPTGANQNTYLLNPLPANYTLAAAGAYTLSRPTGTTAILKNSGGTTVFSYDISSTADVNITGTSGDDTLIVDFGDGSAAKNPLTSQTISFAAGANAVAGDKLQFVNTGAYGSASHTFTNANNGLVAFDVGTVAYTDLETAVEMTGTSIGNLALTLPTGADSAILEDVGTATDGVSRVRGVTFDTFSFPKITGTLTINSGAGDAVAVNALDTTFSATGLTVKSSGGLTSLTLGANNVIPDGAAVTLVGTKFDLSGKTETIGSLDGDAASILVYSGSTSLTVGGNGASTSFTGTINAGAGALTKVGTGTFTISGVITMAGGQLNTNAGALTISNVANSINAASTLSVPTGGTATIKIGATSSIGSAKIDVSGGKVVVTGSPTQTVPNALLQRWYNTPGLSEANTWIDSTTGTPQADGLGGIGDTPNAGLLTYGPVVGSKLLTSAISFANLAAFNAGTTSPLTGSSATFGDNFSFLWTGKFTAVKAGSYTFGAGQGVAGVDDEFVILIDLNNDGQFDNATERVADTIGGCCGAYTGDFPVDFVAGETHDIAIAFQEFGGGEDGSGTFMIAGDPTFGAFTAINPGAANQAGMWTYVGAPLVAFSATSNNVSVSGTSTIEMSSDLGAGVSLGTLTMAAGASLAVNGGATGQTLKFTGATSLAGSETLNAADGVNLRLAGQITGAGGFTKSGAGSLFLDGASNNYAGATVVNAGTVFLDADSSLGATTAGTTVNNGGQIALRANYNPAEPLTISGGALSTQSPIAPFESTGDFKFTGPITLGAAAQIRSSSGTLTLSGGINNGGNALHFGGGGTVVVSTVGISGSGPLRRLDGGATQLSVANTYTGATEIENGSVLFAVGLGAGATHITGTGSMIYTGSSDLVYAGALTIDSNASIASRSAKLTIAAALPVTGALKINNESVNDNTVVFTAPIALTQNLNIQVGGGGGNGGTGVLAGIISGGFGINKTGNGILTLANNNTYTGTNTVLAGTLAAGAPNAFGTTANGTVASKGASIGLSADPAGIGNFTLNPAEPLTFVGAGVGGNGALVNLQGNNTVSSVVAPIIFATTIGSLSGTLNLTSNLGVTGTLTFAGSGNVSATGVISNGAAVTLQPGILETIWNGVVANAQDNINGYIAAAVGPADGTGVLLGDLSYPNDAAFSTRAAELGAVGFDNGDFSALWLTTFTPNESGQWGLRFTNVDDNASFWIDADKDGVFQDTERVYNRGCCGSSGDQLTPALTSGQNYRLGIVASDTGGAGLFTNMQFKSPTAAGVTGGNWVTVNPTTYPNTFRFLPQVSNAVIKTGTGTATLSGNNTYTGTTTVNGGTLSAASPTALGPVGTGTTVNSGGTLQFTNVTYSNLEPVTVKGAGAVVGSGTSSFAGPISTPTIVFGNHQTTQPNPSTTIDTSGAAHGRYVRVQQNLATGADGYLSLAEVEVYSGGNNVALSKTATQISDYSTLAVAPKAVDGNMDGVYNDGSITHTATDAHNNWWQVDLGSSFAIDSIVIWNRTDCCSIRLRDYYVFVSETPFLPTDTIESLAGANTPSIGTTLAGDTLTLTGPITINSAAANPSSVTFNGPGVVTVNGVIGGLGNVAKSGTGSATFAAANTYGGNTTVTGGTLNTKVSNALGSGFTTSTLKVTGTASVVNLFDSASAETKVGNANFVFGQGTVNTGAGKLHVANSMLLKGNYTVTGDVFAVGANLIDNLVQRTLTEAGTAGTMTLTRPPAPLTIGIVDAPTPIVQLATLSPAVATTPFKVTGGSVLVVNLSLRTDVAPNTGSAVMWDNGSGPQPLTLAGRATYAPVTPLFSRDSSIWYLNNPLPGTGTLSVQSPDGSTGPESWISAYTLSNVNTTVAPRVGTSSNVTGIAPPVALTGVAEGSWMSIAEGAFPGTTDFTWSAVGAGPVTNPLNFKSVALNSSVNFGIFQNVSQGSPTDDYSIVGIQTDTGAAASRNNRTVAAFSPALAGTGVIDLPATNIVLPAGTSLKLNNSGAATLGNISLDAGATVSAGASTPTGLTVNNLSGVGTLSLPLTVAGEVAPGAGPGIVNTAAGVGLKTGASLKVELNGATAGTQYDQLNVAGAVTLNSGGGAGATLNVALGYTPAVGQQFTIITNDGTDALVGTFNGLAQGATFVAGGATFTISYTGGTGNDVVLTAQAAGATTTTILVATPLATTGGSSVQFTATVAPSPGALGTVTFLDGGAPIPGGSNVAVTNGQAIFSTTSLAVGTHPVTASYSGAAGFAPSVSSAQSVVISSGATAPTVLSVDTNIGVIGFTGAQHSRVVNLTVVFDQAVQLDTNAMTMALHANNVIYGGAPGQPTGAVAPSTLNVTGSTDKKTWTITFDGLGTVDTGGDLMSSLKEGVYDLKIDKTKVHPLGAATVNMAADSVTVVHRLYGDVNAASQTSATDFAALDNSVDNLSFRNAFNKTAGNAGYVAYLDLTGDGTINSSDNLAFRQRFNKTLSWTV